MPALPLGWMPAMSDGTRLDRRTARAQGGARLIRTHVLLSSIGGSAGGLNPMPRCPVLGSGERVDQRPLLSANCVTVCETVFEQPRHHARVHAHGPG